MEKYRLYPGKVRGLGNIITTRKFTDMELFHSGLSPFSFTIIRGYFNQDDGQFYSDEEFTNLIPNQPNQKYYDVLTSTYYEENDDHELEVIEVDKKESSTIVDGVNIGVFRLGSASIPLKLKVEVSELSVGFPAVLTCTITTVNEPILPVQGLEVLLYADDTLVGVSRTTNSEGEVTFNYPYNGDIMDVDEVTVFRVVVSSQDGYQNVSKTINADIQTSSTPIITLFSDKTDLTSTNEVVTFTGTLYNRKNEPLGTVQKKDSQGNPLVDGDGFPVYESYYGVDIQSTGGSTLSMGVTDEDGNFTIHVPFNVSSHVVAYFVGRNPVFDENSALVEYGYNPVTSEPITIKTHSTFEELQRVLTEGQYSVVFDVFIADGISDFYMENDEIQYYDEGDLVVVKKSYNEINSFSDLEGAVVGINRYPNGDWKINKLDLSDVTEDSEGNVVATEYYLDLFLDISVEDGSLYAEKLTVVDFEEEE